MQRVSARRLDFWRFRLCDSSRGDVRMLELHARLALELHEWSLAVRVLVT